MMDKRIGLVGADGQSNWAGWGLLKRELGWLGMTEERIVLVGDDGQEYWAGCGMMEMGLLSHCV